MIAMSHYLFRNAITWEKFKLEPDWNLDQFLNSLQIHFHSDVEAQIYFV